MKQMRLMAMAETYYNSLQTGMCKDYTIDQFIALLVDQEWEYRHNKKITNCNYSVSNPKKHFFDINCL